MAFFSKIIEHVQVNNNATDTITIAISDLAGYSNTDALVIRSVFASNLVVSNTTVGLNIAPVSVSTTLAYVNSTYGQGLLLNSFDNPLIFTPIGNLEVTTIAPVGNTITIKIDYQFVNANLLTGSFTVAGTLGTPIQGINLVLGSQSSNYLVKNMTIIGGTDLIEIYLDNGINAVTVSPILNPQFSDASSSISFLLPAGYSIYLNVTNATPPPISYCINTRFTN